MIPGTPDDLPEPPDRNPPSSGVRRGDHSTLTVHTGDGKGKTTAAFGSALRAWHQGWPIAVYQFVKSGRWRSGEQATFAALDRLHRETGQGAAVTWRTLGAGLTWQRDSFDRSAQAGAARRAWSEIREALAEQRHRLYVLDEFTYPLTFGWLDLEDVVRTLAGRPGEQHVIITGRDAPAPLLDLATTVTEMTKVKHGYDIGMAGRAGIEW